MSTSVTTFKASLLGPWPLSIFARYIHVELTLSHPEALPWRVKSYSVRQSKLIKGTVLASLGEKGLRKRDGQVCPVNPSCLLVFNYDTDHDCQLQVIIKNIMN